MNSDLMPFAFTMPAFMKSVLMMAACLSSFLAKFRISMGNGCEPECGRGLDWRNGGGEAGG